MPTTDNQRPATGRVGGWAGAILLAIALLAGCAPKPGEPVEAQAGPYSLAAALAPDPPKESGGRLQLEVTQNDGSMVAGAEVTVGYFMPAMGAMAQMKGNLDVQEKPDGVYIAELDLPMSGSWRIDVAVQGPQGRGTAAYGLTVGGKGLRVQESSPAPRQATAPAQQTLSLPQKPYPAAAYAALTAAFEAYEDARAALAADHLAGVEPAAQASQRALATASGALSGQPEANAIAVEAGRAAGSLAAATDLETARSAFGELSRVLLLLASADERLTEGLAVWSCPMTETFPKWLQAEGEKENPYMGQQMPTCGEASDWTVTSPEALAEVMAHADAAHGSSHRHEGEDGVAYYTCSMHPSVRSQDPGTCPICSMNLVPVTNEEIETGTIRIDPERRQEIGVRTEVVVPRAMTTSVRAVGRVTYDETLKSDVSLKIGGWIGRLEVDEPGQYVRRGQTLFTLYSPELYAAQQEYLTVLASQRTAAETAVPGRADYLVEAARQRLKLWDLSPAQIDSLAETGEPSQYLSIQAPTSGYVVEKNVVAGATVRPGERLFAIAGLDRVWVDAEVYESDLPSIQVGQPALVSLEYLPGKVFEGEVAFIYPYLEGATRTGRVRVELPNPDLELKPEMYASVTMERELGELLTVPDEALLYAGERSFVFLDLGDGRLQPRQVETGVVSGDRVAVLDGLEPGDRIVVSGNFLVAAEARLKLAMEQWR